MSLNARELVLLNTKYEMNNENDTLGSSKAQLDILSNTYPYDMDKNCQLQPLDCQSLVSNDTHNSFRNVLCNHSLRYPLLQLRFNAHDYNHYKACFKNNCECPFHLPKNHTPVDCILFDDVNAFDWFYVNGSSRNVSRYEYMSQRNKGDQLLNVNNDLTTLLLGCNSNIGVAGRAEFFL